MTTNDVFGRNLSTWLHEDAEHHVPDHLAEVLQRTAATRQRPAWSSLERWLPMDTTLRPRLITLPRGGRLVLVAALILMLSALAVIAVGTYQTRVPDPFGLARNGMIVTSRDGDLYLMNQATTESRLVPAGDDRAFDFSPIFSRDGTKLIFLRSDGPLPSSGPAVLTLYVAKADGSEARPLTPPTRALDWFDWSPDGTSVAFMSRGGLYVVDIDEAKPRQIKNTGTMHFPTWLPPDGKEIVYRLESARPAIYAIAADGTGERRQLSTTPANNRFDYQSIAVSPDGAHITFTRWESDVPDADTAGWWPRVYALEVKTGEEMLFPTAPGTGQRGLASYSPDGSLVAYARVYRTGAFQIVVANADGSGNEREIGPRKTGPRDGSEIPASWAFTPDGTALMVRYGDDAEGTTQLLPLDGSPATSLGSGGFEFVDMQRLAP